MKAILDAGLRGLASRENCQIASYRADQPGLYILSHGYGASAVKEAAKILIKPIDSTMLALLYPHGRNEQKAQSMMLHPGARSGHAALNHKNRVQRNEHSTGLDFFSCEDIDMLRDSVARFFAARKSPRAPAEAARTMKFPMDLWRKFGTWPPWAFTVRGRIRCSRYGLTWRT